ncbi:hypothetical protein K9M50_01905 [Patescibacteria group bacterium]|nr:hypothetical protein [Patescibacteria group bacterium]
MKKIISYCLFLSLIIGTFLPTLTKAAVDSEFDPNNIISDSLLLDTDSMTLEDIQYFLEDQGSYLANYKTRNTYGDIKTAAQIIYEASINNYNCDGIKLSDTPSETEKNLKCKKIKTVNPKFLLVLLQKEQSLIEETNPTQRQLDWATGYGCPDGSSCNPYWQGFGKQVNSAALQFWWYMNYPKNYNYKMGTTYTFNNPYGTIETKNITATPQNKATAALYNYTPHVFNGNYNVYKLFKRYFPPTAYPNGTLLQAKGEIGVWLIEDGKRRPFLSKSALVSRFDENKIVEVDSTDLNAYIKGNPIKFSNYSLIKSPKGTIYLLVDNKKRKFSSIEAFKNIGYSTDEIQNASWQDINSYKDGAPITMTSTYPTGALLQDNITGGVYWVEEGKKHAIIDKSFLNTKFKNKSIIPVDPSELAQYDTGSKVLFDDGELLKSPLTTAVYLIDNGKKRPFASGEDFVSLGYKWENIITTSPQVLYEYPKGDILSNK